MKDSLCSKCVHGHFIVGKVLHRHTVVDSSDSEALMGGMPGLDDYLDEEEQAAFSSEPSLEVKEEYLNTVTSVCYFPHIPCARLPPNFESFAFTDGIVEKCSRYQEMEV